MVLTAQHLAIALCVVCVEVDFSITVEACQLFGGTYSSCLLKCPKTQF